MDTLRTIVACRNPKATAIPPVCVFLWATRHHNAWHLGSRPYAAIGSRPYAAWGAVVMEPGAVVMGLRAVVMGLGAVVMDGKSHLQRHKAIYRYYFAAQGH